MNKPKIGEIYLNDELLNNFKIYIIVNVSTCGKTSLVENGDTFCGWVKPEYYTMVIGNKFLGRKIGNI